MGKIIPGLFLGFVLSYAAIGHASNVVDAVLYPVKVYFNGQPKELPDEYPILNVNGHAYIPIRFFVEGFDGKVTFNQDEPSINVSLSSITPMPMNSYTPKNAILNGDIVHGDRWYNIDKLASFYQNIADKHQGWIRITRFSDEGDPTFVELLYDGNKLWYMMDPSRDAYGGEKSRIMDICEKLDKKSDGSYWLTGCKKLPPTSIPELRQNQY